MAAKLVAFYAPKAGAKVSFQNAGKSGTRVLPSGIWTIVEDVTGTSQIINTQALQKLGVLIHSIEFRTTPPFGIGGSGPKATGRFAVIPAGTDSSFIIDSYDGYINKSKNAAEEIKNAIILEKIDPTKIYFKNVDFAKVDFSKVDWTNAKISIIDLSDVDFTTAVFTKVNFEGITFGGGGIVRGLNDNLGGNKGGYVGGEVLNNLDLSKVDFSAVDFTVASEELLNVEDLDFSGVDFSKVDYSKVEFKGLIFDKTVLRKLTTATTKDVKKAIASADFSGVDFSGLDFSKVDFVGGNIFVNLLLKSNGGFGLKVDLSAVDFSNLNFTNVNFDKVDFANS